MSSALDERHWLRLMRDYVSDYHQDRIHDSLEKDTPQPAGNRAAAGGDRKRDFPAPPRWPAPSLRMARSGVEALPKGMLSGRRWIASMMGSDPAERKLCRVAPPGSIGAARSCSTVAGAQLHLAAATDRIRFTLHNVTGTPVHILTTHTSLPLCFTTPLYTSPPHSPRPLFTLSTLSFS